MSVLKRIGRNVLKWFGHVERMGEERLVNAAYRANRKGNRRRGRSQRRWRDKVKELLMRRMVLAGDRLAWGGMMYRSTSLSNICLHQM